MEIVPHDNQQGLNIDTSRPLARVENMPTTSNTFKYQPLSNDNSEIRLFRITGGTPDEKIECILETVARSSAPEYKALSYSWGTLSQDHEIVVNGCSFLVTENLFAALMQLRPTSQDLLLWIDAVCINQGSADNEKSDQVREMRSVYECASEVLVWLGNASTTSRLAFSYIHDMTGLFATDGSIDDCIADPHRYGGLMALHELLLRDYWKRMWVIQETCVAKSVTVHCGTDSTGWNELVAAQTGLGDHEPAMLNFSSRYKLGMAFLNQIWTSGALGMKSASPLIEEQGRDPTLYESLLHHCGKVCLYPIDRVYSIIGLTSARHDARFVIDYNRGVRRVFIDVAQYTILTSRKLDVICALQPIPGSRNLVAPDLPSWVPNWAAASPYENSLFTGEKRQCYKACTNNADITFDLDGSALMAKGFVIGKVSSLGSTSGISSAWETNNEDIPNLLRALHNWISMLMTPDGFVSKPHHVIFRDTITCALVYDRFFPGWSTEKYLDELMGMYGRLCEKYHPDLVLDPHWKLLTDDNSNWKSESDRDHWAQTAILNNKRVLFRRRFFLAEPGLTGVGHEDVVVGDKICILYGMQTPVILRSVDTYYTLVGETFVSGRNYMLGAAMDELAKGHHKEELFEIH